MDLFYLNMEDPPDTLPLYPSGLRLYGINIHACKWYDVALVKADLWKQL